MRKRIAAAYLDMGEAAFLREVAQGTFCEPLMVGGGLRWDRFQIDKDLDRLFGTAPYDWRKDQPGLTWQIEARS